MEKKQFIATDEFCSYYRVEQAFIRSLQEHGLIEIKTAEEKGLIQMEKLPEVEKYIRLHYDLEINIAGIDAIMHLLKRVADMHDEIVSLKNRLRVYE